MIKDNAKKKQRKHEMKAVSLNLKDFLTATCYDPSPHRFRESDTSVSERNLPVEYICENCGYPNLCSSAYVKPPRYVQWETDSLRQKNKK